jgi:hypothetical protein
MKKIIDGKRYNTDTADHVANYNNCFPSGDFHWINKDIYITSKGSWFLHSSGGAMTLYCQQTGPNEWSGGERIDVLTPEEAREWLEEHGQTEALERYFPFEDA